MFKDQFTYLRKRSGYSQREIAEQLKVSSSAVAMWELGKRVPPLETLELIADYFNVSMSFLIGEQEKSVPQKDTLYDKINQSFAGLSPEQIQQVLDYAAFLKSHK